MTKFWLWIPALLMTSGIVLVAAAVQTAAVRPSPAVGGEPSV
jgi:hypothetical protein